MGDTTDYLVFTLAAPMASFGAVAVGERRPSWNRPSKSQVLGLVAGALGIERTEEGRQRELATALGFAVRVDEPGTLTVDYHTTQVPPARRNRRFATRADELAVGNSNLKTILSRREFRTGAINTIVLWRTADGAPPLVDIDAALRMPMFVPFAGRKSHPLMLPMRPGIVAAASITAAFDAYDRSEPPAVADLKAQRHIASSRSAPREIYVDADAVPRSEVDRLEERRDMPESRAKWRFGLRTEALLRAPAQGDIKGRTS